MTSVPDELADVWQELAQLGWRIDRLEEFRRAPEGERNRVYFARHDGVRVVIRLPGKHPGRKKKKSYNREMHNLVAAAELGVTPTPLLADPSDGLLVLPFVSGSHPVRREVAADSAVRIARCLRKLHDEASLFLEGTDFLGRIRRRVRQVVADRPAASRHSRDLPKAARNLVPVLDALDRTAPPLASCHGDLVLANIIDDGQRAYLIDWETSCAGDPHQDVGTVLLRARLNDDVREAFLAEYFHDRPIEEARQGRLRVRLWETARALDKALIYWRNGQRTGKIDPRVKGWTRRCVNLLRSGETRAALSVLESQSAGSNPERK